MRRIAILTALAVASGGCLLADFSYEQTTKMTGGAMMSMMKIAGAFSKQLREPMHNSVLVKGNRMAQINSYTTQIIDLDKETITEIDHQRKSYAVVSFAEWAQALQSAAAKEKKRNKDEADMQMSVKGSVKETGQTKQINGASAKEMIMTLEMEGTDPKTNQRTIAMTITSDMWITPQAGYDEVKNFYARLAEKLKWVPGGFAMQSAEVSQGMADLYKEAAKIDGVPVIQIWKMGAGNLPQGEGGAQPQQSAQPQQEQEKPSLGGALGRIGGGRLGGFGGLGRRKKQEEQPPQEQQAQPAQQNGQQQPAAGGPGSLMEATSELTNFSTAAVDASKFEVPAGYKQGESNTLKTMRR